MLLLLIVHTQVYAVSFFAPFHFIFGTICSLMTFDYYLLQFPEQLNQELILVLACRKFPQTSNYRIL